MDESESPGLFVGDEPSHDSDDNISLTSTVPEADQIEYKVEKILCEGERPDGEPVWLVDWFGYPITEATWEPRENFTNNIPIDEWEITKKRMDEEGEPPFDVDKWEAERKKVNRATEERRRKRRQRRRELEAVADGRRKPTSNPLKRPSSSTPTPRKGVAVKRTRKESNEPSDAPNHTEPTRKPTSTSSALPSVSKKPDGVNAPSNRARESARQATASEPPPRPSSATAKATDRPVAGNPVALSQSSVASRPSTGSPRGPAPIAPMAPMRPPVVPASKYSMFGGTTSTTSTAKRTSNSASMSQKVIVMTNDPSARRKSTTRSATPRNLQHMNRLRKLAQEEQAPDQSALKLFDPSKGKAPVNRIPAESYAGVPATDPAPSTAIAGTATAGTATASTATASAAKQPLVRNTPPTDTLSITRPMPPTTSSNGGSASASAVQGPSIRGRNVSQPNVGDLSLNATESGSTAKILDAIEDGEILPARAPTATMVSSTDNPQTYSGAVSKPRQPETQPTAAQPRMDPPGDGVRIYPSGFTRRRWLKSLWFQGQCPRGAYCKFEHHHCAKVEPKLKARCEHWKRGSCRFTDELCQAWHAEIDPRTGEPPNVSSSYNDIENILRTMPPVGSSSTTVSSFVPPPSTTVTGLLPQPITSVSIPSSTSVKPKSGTVCRFWFQGKCVKSPCFRAHHRCDRIEAKTLKVCKFWRSGHCDRTDAECQYYHQEFDDAGRPLRKRLFETCPAWKVGACPKGEDRCEYYHVYWDPFSQQHDPPEVEYSTGANGFMDIDDLDTDEPGLFHDTSVSTPEVIGTQPSLPTLSSAHQSSLPPTRPPPPSQPSRSLSLPLATSLTPRVPISGSDEEVFMNEMIVKLCEEQLQLKSERLFTGTNGMVFDKVVCLMFPPSQVAEITLITRYLQAIGATVVNPEIPGSWRAFIREPQDKSKKRSGVILYHPSIFNYHRLCNIRVTLHEGSFNHFQLGIDAALQDHPQARTVYSCIRLFPHGDLVLLPDDLLFHEPAKALQIVKLFHTNLKPKPIGGRNERLVFRPGLRELLAELIVREDEQATRVELYLEITKLYRKYEKMKFPGSIQPKHVNIVSEPIQSAPKYAAMWAEDEAKATNWLVEWFAGWCLLQRERFRRFTIIASNDKGEAAMKWKRHYQHVAVWSPEKYLINKKR